MDDRSKLEETLELPATDSELIRELEEKFKFSDDPDLKEIAKLALESYKSQMMDIMNFEPKYRSRALEVANQYLNLAKDALAKNEDLDIKRDKGKPKDDEETPKESGVDRNALLLEFNKKNKSA